MAGQFAAILTNHGARRLEVMACLRDHLKLTTAAAKALLDAGPVVLISSADWNEANILATKFRGLGAEVQLQNMKSRVNRLGEWLILGASLTIPIGIGAFIGLWFTTHHEFAKLVDEGMPRDAFVAGLFIVGEITLFSFVAAALLLFLGRERPPSPYETLVEPKSQERYARRLRIDFRFVVWVSVWVCFTALLFLLVHQVVWLVAGKLEPWSGAMLGAMLGGSLAVVAAFGMKKG